LFQGKIYKWQAGEDNDEEFVNIMNNTSLLFLTPKSLARHISSPEDRITSIKHCAPRISSKMATIVECIEFALKNIGL
jgi:hypothetical protein